MKDTATPRLRGLARSGEIGGVVLFPADEQLRRPGEADRSAAEGCPARRQPAAADRDRPGGRHRQAPRLDPAAALALHAGPEQQPLGLEAGGPGDRLSAAHLGIGVDLAPVLDVPDSSEDQFMFVRAFGSIACAGHAARPALRTGPDGQGRGRHRQALSRARPRSREHRLRADHDHRLAGASCSGHAAVPGRDRRGSADGDGLLRRLPGARRRQGPGALTPAVVRDTCAAASASPASSSQTTC